MLPAITSIIAVLLWWFVGGPLIFVNAVSHSETNLLVSYAKKDNTGTFKLRVYQVLHCIGYVVWVVGLFTLPIIIKHLMA